MMDDDVIEGKKIRKSYENKMRAQIDWAVL